MTRRQPNSWSDGIHYVRYAPRDERDALPWLAAAHRKPGAALLRHCTSLDDALRVAMRATKLWLKTHPAGKAFLKESYLPEASSIPGPRRRRGRPPKIKPKTFSTYHFECILANPYAQVWQCVTKPGEKKPAGRKRHDGKTPEQATFPHEKGECAVLVGPDPVRDETGEVKVFASWQAAEEHATDLYENAPEEEVISWRPNEGTTAGVVARTPNFDIYFDADKYGTKRPFYIWFPRKNDFVFRDTTRPANPTGDDKIRQRGMAALQETNPKLYLELKEQRRRQLALDRVPAFSTEPMRFRSIWETINEAERREAMLRGETT